MQGSNPTLLYLLVLFGIFLAKRKWFLMKVAFIKCMKDGDVQVTSQFSLFYQRLQGGEPSPKGGRMRRNGERYLFFL